jgi:ABC-type Fe3+-siderophore transport system permease subunit
VGQSGDTISIPSGATLSVAGSTSGITNTPLVQAGFSSASQSISSGADTEIVYTTITKETPTGKFSTSTGRFTPGVVGLYYVSALARINGGNGAGEFANLQIRVNGSASTNGTQQGATYRRIQSDGAENSFAVHCIVELTSITDYISVYIYQNQGGSQTLQADHTNFTAYKLLT